MSCIFEALEKTAAARSGSALATQGSVMEMLRAEQCEPASEKPEIAQQEKPEADEQQVAAIAEAAGEGEPETDQSQPIADATRERQSTDSSEQQIRPNAEATGERESESFAPLWSRIAVVTPVWKAAVEREGFSSRRRLLVIIATIVLMIVAGACWTLIHMMSASSTPATVIQTSEMQSDAGPPIRLSSQARVTVPGQATGEPNPEGNDSDAEFLLATQYAAGSGVPHDDAKAFKLLLDSARRGNIQAEYALARCYWLARGTTKDLTSAYYWASKADQAGHSDAKQLVMALTDMLTPLDLKEAKKRPGSDQ